MFKEKIFPGRQHSFVLNCKKNGKEQLLGTGNLFNRVNLFANGRKEIGNRCKFQRIHATNLEVQSISCNSSFHTLFLTKNGLVYGSGDNRCGQLGTEIKTWHNFSRIKFFKKKVKAIFTGPKQSFIEQDNGDLYVCGLNAFDELGLGISKVNIYKPKKLNLSFLESYERIIDIKGDSIILTDHGNVYSCGKKFVDIFEKHHFKVMEFFKKKEILITQFDCDLSNSYYLSKLRKVFHISHPNGFKSAQVTEISFLREREVTKIECGGNVAFFVTKYYEIYAYGKDWNHQSGIECKEERLYKMIKTPTLVRWGNGNLEYKFIDICAGSSTSYFVNTYGDIYVFGNNDFGQAGIGYFTAFQSLKVPTKIEGVKIKLEKKKLKECELGESMCSLKDKNCIYSNIVIKTFY